MPLALVYFYKSFWVKQQESLTESWLNRVKQVNFTNVIPWDLERELKVHLQEQ